MSNELSFRSVSTFDVDARLLQLLALLNFNPFVGCQTLPLQVYMKADEVAQEYHRNEVEYTRDDEEDTKFYKQCLSKLLFVSFDYMAGASEKVDHHGDISNIMHETHQEKGDDQSNK